MSQYLDPIPMWTDDDFAVKYTWVKPDGTPQDITGSTVEALAQHVSDGTTVSLETWVEDGPNGVQGVRMVGADLSTGVWDMQIECDIAENDGRTGPHRAVVHQSFTPPA